MSWSVNTDSVMRVAVAPKHQAELERMRESFVERISANPVVQPAAEIRREIEHIALLAGIVQRAIRREIMAIVVSPGPCR